MIAPRPDPAKGATLAGRYRLEAPLGSGATSAVWRATDTALEREVAVKVLRADVEGVPARRFHREARILARLDHPNLVRVLDAGTADGRAYIVMELVAGRSLHDVASAGPLPAAEAAGLVAQVCDGLAHVHGHGVVHRDLKPANILVTPGGVPRLVDFGIARADTSTTVTGAVLGTAMYLSPEQARGGPVDARSDVYAAGCVLYELLTGAPPFTGESAVAVAHRHVHEEPLPPSAHVAGIPAELEGVVLRALAKDPAARPDGAAALASELRGAAAEPGPGATAVLRPAGPRASRAADGRRRRRVAVGAALVAVGVLAAALVSLAAASGRADGTTTTVPDVRGMPFEDASATLADAGLEVARADVGDVAPAGTVVGQSPRGGTEVDEGSGVALTVSTGPPTVEDPEPEDTEDRDEDGRGRGRKRGKEDD